MNTFRTSASRIRAGLLLTLAGLGAVPTKAQTVSPVQAKAEPFGLVLAGKVMLAGSDEASKEFQTKVLPSVTKLVSQGAGDDGRFNKNALLLDPSKLYLKNDADLRVYFVGEDTSLHNTLGFLTQGAGITKGNPMVIFPDASTKAEFDGDGNKGNGNDDKEVKRNKNEPLAPGDFVDLGQYKAGTQLDFFLIANGANKGKEVFSTTPSANPDGQNHVVSYVSVFSSYLLIGFEDQARKGEMDYNDLVFAINLSSVSLGALTATPEPGTWLTLGSFLGAGVWMARRRQATKA
jgi:hypothetical protein